MTNLAPTRGALHRIAVHVLARARVEAAGRFSLRVAPGGIGTPEFGADGRRVRISGDRLIVESDAVGAASVRSVAIAGATLARLAAVAGVDLRRPLDVGHDTPPVGDPDAVITVDAGAAHELAGWYRDVTAMLDGFVAAVPDGAETTLPRLWPEHFDVAVEAQATPARRVNLGGSPGDGFCDEPYLYVGPWTADRPGDPGFWNAPFGAVRRRSELADDDDPVTAGIAFLLDGYGRLV
jgi:hypothetical protein